MIQFMLHCLTCCFVIRPHSHNSKVIKICITKIWVCQAKLFFWAKQMISRYNLCGANAISNPTPIAHLTLLLFCTIASMVGVVWVLLDAIKWSSRIWLLPSCHFLCLFLRHIAKIYLPKFWSFWYYWNPHEILRKIASFEKKKMML